MIESRQRLLDLLRYCRGMLHDADLFVDVREPPKPRARHAKKR